MSNPVIYPAVNEWNRGFFEAAAAGTLALPTCAACSHQWFPPSRRCPHCLSTTVFFKPASGRGTLWSWVVMHREYFPQFPPAYPVIMAQLEEGPLVVSTLAQGSAHATLKSGMPLRAVFRPTPDGRPLLTFNALEAASPPDRSATR
jgi:uncharacterized OB-fold protein